MNIRFQSEHVSTLIIQLLQQPNHNQFIDVHAIVPNIIVFINIIVIQTFFFHLNPEFAQNRPHPLRDDVAPLLQ